MNTERPPVKMGIIKHIIGVCLFGFLGYLLSGIIVGLATRDGILNSSDRIIYVLTHPLSNWNRYSLLFILAGVGAWFLFAVYESAKKNKK